MAYNDASSGEEDAMEEVEESSGEEDEESEAEAEGQGAVDILHEQLPFTGMDETK